MNQGDVMKLLTVTLKGHRFVFVSFFFSSVHFWMLCIFYDTSTNTDNINMFIIHCHVILMVKRR